MSSRPVSPPLVSILVPCHNGARWLRETLESALAQTYSPCEVIVVDDGSTDDSLAIARSFAPRVTVFTGPQQGASAARDTATQHARGAWLQYLDADDLLLPDAISRRVEALDAAAGDLACADWRRLVPDSAGSWTAGKLESADPSTFAPEPDLAVFKGFWAPPAALLYRRELVTRIGRWHPGLPVIQDARFLLDAAICGGRFIHVPGESALYRQHTQDSLSTRNPGRFWRDILTNTREVEALWRERGCFSGERRTVVSGAYSFGARVSFSVDEQLYRENLAELQRFPEQHRSLYLRAARFLEKVVGYRFARRLLNRLRPPRVP